jgi:hypothetical protein
MPKVNLPGMTIEALMDLRKQVDDTLVKRRADIERQLARMDGASGALPNSQCSIFCQRGSKKRGGQGDRFSIMLGTNVA